MDLIYEPTGKAREYAPLALNIYKSCPHGCTYCYAPASMHMKKEDFHGRVKVKKDVISRLTGDLHKLREQQNDKEVHLCFIGDLYCRDTNHVQAIQHAGLASHIIQLFIQYDQPFTILTKGGLLAVNDFPLLAGYDKCSFGVSMVFWNELSRFTYEPGASPLIERIQSLKMAKDLGIRTIVSLEPVIDPSEALEIIDHLYPYVDFWKIGKINYNKALEERVNWELFVKEIRCREKLLELDLMLKESLKKYER